MSSLSPGPFALTLSPSGRARRAASATVCACASSSSCSRLTASGAWSSRGSSIMAGSLMGMTDQRTARALRSSGGVGQHLALDHPDKDLGGLRAGHQHPSAEDEGGHAGDILVGPIGLFGAHHLAELVAAEDR